MADQSEAEKQSAERVDKAVWMNEQLSERLPGAEDTQPGVEPAKGARADNDYPVKGGKTTRARKPAADQS